MASRENETIRLESRPLRSLNYDIPTYVKFVNNTDRLIFLFWFGYDGKIVNYSTLGPRGTEEMNTYVTHPWMVKDHATSFTLLMNGKTVFYPREHIDDIPFNEHQRDVINIQIPVFSLLQRCVEVVFLKYGKDKIRTLDLPRELKQTLTNVRGPSYDRSYDDQNDDDDEYYIDDADDDDDDANEDDQ